MKQYVVTEPEFLALIDKLRLVEAEREHDPQLTPTEQNRLNTVHRMFHLHVVRWVQAMGFSGLPS